MRSVWMHPDPAAPVDGESGSGAPAQGPPGDFLDSEISRQLALVQPAQSGQLLPQNRRLESALGVVVGVLPVAATALARTSNWTGRRDPSVGGNVDLDGIGTAVAGVAVLGDFHRDPLTGQCMPDEDHPSLMSGHTVPAVSYRPDLHLEAPTLPARTHPPRVSLAPIGPGLHGDRVLDQRELGCHPG